MQDPPALSRTLNRSALERAWRRARRSKGAGIDGVDAARFEARLGWELDRLAAELATGRYQPRRLLRLSIPKPGGGRRPLGVPTVRDRLVQVAVLQQVQPALDPRLHPKVHGFRPRRSPGTAIQHLLRQTGRRRWIELIRADVADLFGSLPHRGLREALDAASGDPLWRLLCERWLRAWGGQGVGIPQGAPLSPLWANLFLDRHLDRALDTPAPPRPAAWVRYADDIVLVGERRGAATELLRGLAGLTRGCGLALSPGKTAVVPGPPGALAPTRVLGFQIRLERRRGGCRLVLDRGGAAGGSRGLWWEEVRQPSMGRRSRWRTARLPWGAHQDVGS